MSTTTAKAATTQIKTTTIEAIIYRGSQSWERRHILKMTQGSITRKVKIHIDRDSYDKQSSATAYVWSEEKLEWNKVYSIPWSEMHTCKNGLSYVAPANQVNERHFSTDEARLLQNAKQILF